MEIYSILVSGALTTAACLFVWHTVRISGADRVHDPDYVDQLMKKIDWDRIQSAQQQRSS